MSYEKVLDHFEKWALKDVYLVIKVANKFQVFLSTF